MTTNDTTHDSDSSTNRSRYATIAIEEGGRIIYDRENPEAWIQADGEDATMEVRA